MSDTKTPQKTTVKNNVIDNSVTPTPIITNKIKKQAIQKPQKSQFKSKYFEFYDDVKTHNNGPYDW